jgi:hypothetical protein
LNSVKEYNKFLCYTPESKSVEFSVKHSFTLHPPLNPYRWNHRQRDTYTRCAWAGGTFFPVVLLCQFLVLVGNRFWFYLLCTYVLRVQDSCGVVLFFWFWREIVFGVTYVLSVHYSCAVVSVFWLWREIVLLMRTRFYKKILLGYSL